MALVGAAVFGITSLSLAKANAIAINSMGSNKVAMQAQQYASAKGELYRTMKYSELTAQAKKDIQNSNGFQDEVTVSAETDYPDDRTVKQKICTVMVYKTGEAIPRSTLIVTRYSKSMDASSIPSGSIIPWYGNIADIPDGFVLCNGSNGTPDLRDRFIVGAGNSYALRDIGGVNTVTISKANLPSDGLTGFGYVINGVKFTWRSNIGTISGDDNDWSTVDGSNSYKSWRYYTSFDTVVSNNWKGEPHENRPPFYSLYYLMKI